MIGTATGLEATIRNRLIDPALLMDLPIPLHEVPKGWMHPLDLKVLYSAAFFSDGKILEIGPWLGRSTTAIALGIRDSKKPNRFHTVDLGITSIAEFEALLRQKVPMGDDDTVMRSIHQPGGSTAILIDNLRRLNLLPYVTSVIRGDILQQPLTGGYRMIFCDTLHNEREIDTYGPALDRLLGDGGWLICDDVVDDKFGDMLRRHIKFDVVTYSNAVDKYCKLCIARKATIERH